MTACDHYQRPVGILGGPCQTCGASQLEHVEKPPALCTTNGKPVADVRANQKNETGQHDGYIVLCPDERAKGFVRPYRDAYKHVGHLIARCQITQTGEDHERPRQCIRRTGHEDNHEFTELMLVNGPIQFILLGPLSPREGGCGTVTTMGRALSETYARDPSFYGATFCVTCNRHLPVAEFVWTADGLPVGS